MITFITATRCNCPAFEHQPLGLSLARLGYDDRINYHATFNNTQGLPSFYNSCIQIGDDDDVLIFTHDDVWLDDYFVADRVVDGLKKFDIIGVAGNRILRPSHVGWFFKDDLSQREDPANTSGAVAHHGTPIAPISPFGATPASCELLDGVLLAAKRSTLRGASVEFDPKFEFHFYDLDLCRTARKAGLTLGTWPIAITHNSGGSFGSPAWQHALQIYRAKWG